MGQGHGLLRRPCGGQAGQCPRLLPPGLGVPMCVHTQLLSCLTLCGPVDCSPPGSSVHGFSRQEYWSGLPCPPPGDLSAPGTEPSSLMSPALAAGSSPLARPGSPLTRPQGDGSGRTCKPFLAGQAVLGWMGEVGELQSYQTEAWSPGSPCPDVLQGLGLPCLFPCIQSSHPPRTPETHTSCGTVYAEPAAGGCRVGDGKSLCTLFSPL